jgi:hypothetical protein
MVLAFRLICSVRCTDSVLYGSPQPLPVSGKPTSQDLERKRSATLMYSSVRRCLMEPWRQLVVLRIIAILVVACAAYVFSSGVAFVVMYRVGIRFPSRLAGAVYMPLEMLAQRSQFFADFYNGFQWRMYRRFVKDSPPPPPPRVPMT